MLRKGSRNLGGENIERIRELRNEASASEKVLWEFLRKRRLGVFLLRRQYPIGPYALDFDCLEARVCVEVDGEQHTEREGKDEARDLALERLGIVTLRIPSLLLFQGKGKEAMSFLRTVESTCRSRCADRK